MPPSLTLPFTSDLSFTMQALIRVCYGILLLATLLLSLGPSRWFFTSERYGGYAASDPIVDRIQNPFILACILAAWFTCAAMLVFGYHTVWSSLVNLIICRYYFVHMRWKGILRGMGAPGFMTYWLGACVFFLEYAFHFDPSGVLKSITLFLFRMDFALIMLSAGLYKLICGYPKNEGMEYGMVNPWWGYWWRHYQKLPPRHSVFRTLNHLAYGTEIVAAILMLIPATKTLGAWLIVLSFIFIATHIRLGFLCEMVIVSALIFMEPGSLADQWAQSWSFTVPTSTRPDLSSESINHLNGIIALPLLLYVLMLPFTHAGLWYNFLARKTLPGGLQRALERYANFFGIIIWRVFTVDVVNFFANVYVMDGKSGTRRRYSRFGALDWNSRFRYCHVGEFVCLASLFTTLKYYPSDRSRFNERLLRYSRTVASGSDSLIIFEYSSVRKSSRCFEFIAVVEYAVDIDRGSVEERLLEESFSPRQTSSASPVHEGAYPGTYAPANVAKPSR